LLRRRHPQPFFAILFGGFGPPATLRRRMSPSPLAFASRRRAVDGYQAAINRACARVAMGACVGRLHPQRRP